MRYQKFYTVKEWKRFDRVVERENGIDITAQEVMCKKYDVILTDYKINPIVNLKDLPKKEVAIKILKQFNKKNFDKGMKIFDEGVKGFTSSIDAVTSQLGHNDTSTPKKNKVKIWSDSKCKVKIWSDPPKQKKSKKKRVQNPLHSNRRFKL